MARFRLPPPFHDPEDDVVFPEQQGQTGYRNAAPRVEEKAPAGRGTRFWCLLCAGVLAIWTIAALVMVVFSDSLLAMGIEAIGGGSIGVLILGTKRIARPIVIAAVACSAGVLLITGAGAVYAIERDHAAPPVAADSGREEQTPLVHSPPLVTPGGNPHRVALDPNSWLTENPREIEGGDYHAGRGSLTMMTNPPSLCTIHGATLHTPIRRVLMNAGQHDVTCVSRDGQWRSTFTVTIQPGVETRDMDRALSESSTSER